MAFPTVQSVTRAVQLANVSSFNITLPATINNGDLILILLSSDGNPTYTWDNSTAGTWTELFAANQTTLNKLVAYYKTADGTEDSKVLGITTSVAERFTWHIYRITGWDSVQAATAAGSSTTPDPPNLSPAWGSADTLWLVGLSTNGNSADPVTFPTNYTTNGIYDEADNAAGCGISSSYRTNAASSENPGTFTVSASDGWVAATIAVEPVASADALTATGIATGAPTVGTSTLTQRHVLTATGIATGAPTVGTSTLAQLHVLTATGVATGAPTVGTAALTQLHTLTATSVATGAPTVGTTTLTAESNQDNLAAASASTGAPTVGTATVTQRHALTATGVSTGAVTITRPTLNPSESTIEWRKLLRLRRMTTWRKDFYRL